MSIHSDRLKTLVHITLLAVSTGTPAVSLAQQKSTATLEEITVSAQRREQSVQDVPLAVSAFGGEALIGSGVDTPGAVAKLVPNVQLQDNGLVTRLNIRGVTLTDTGDANESPVSLYIDDVYQASVAAMPLALFDVDRVEVLRGPQGTLYGRNSTGGLVHYISRRPTDQLDGNLDVTYGSYGRFIADGAIGGPMSDGLRGRLAFRIDKDRGWQKNTFTGERWAKTDLAAVRGQLDARVSDSVTALLNVHFAQNLGVSPGYAFFGARNPSNPTQICGHDDVVGGRCVSFGANAGYPAGGFRVPDPSPTETLSDVRNPQNETKTHGGSLTLTWTTGSTKVESITAYESLNRYQFEDYEASQYRPGDVDDVYADNEQFSEELRVSGETGNTTWVVGAYYFDSSDKVGLGYPGFGLPKVNDSTVDTESIAAFGQADFKLGDGWIATLGARYTNEDKSHEGILYGGNLAVVDRFRYDVSDSVVTWRAAVTRDLGAAGIVYVSAATGFKSPAFNTTGLFSKSDGAPTESEKLTSYEIGSKTSFADGQAAINLSAFYYDYKNVQGTYTDPSVCSTGACQVFANFGDSTNYGVELETQFAPTDAWLVRLSAGYLSTKIDSVDPALNGNELPSSPELSANGTVRYRVALANASSLALQADFRWQDKYFFAPQNNPIALTEAYGILDLSATWASASGKYSVRLYVDNATDEEYLSHAFSMAGYTGTMTGIWGRPRTWGVSARVSL